MMVITPANGSGAPSDSLLRALFDLTPSEARIARGIAEGATLEEMAAGHAVTVGTIRAQAKSVFAKTGMHRQAQVAALLVGLGKIR
jgi:DNA-binding CsgD family transcriptional regulator